MQQAEEIIRRLTELYPNFETALTYKKDWQLLLAVIMSAQTTDANVNSVTNRIYEKYTSIRQIAEVGIEELEQDIRSTGYYKSKAKNVQNCCKELIERYNSKLPETLDELITLPGVGRKTANVVLHVLHDKAEGIVMDTHISRLTMRLGFIDEKHPEKAEQVMMKLLPKKQWRAWGDLLIQHGREVCKARKPECKKCILNDICPSATVT